MTNSEGHKQGTKQRIESITKAEFSHAVAIAKSDADLTDYDDSNLDGCGLPDFGCQATPICAVAKLLRWQAHQFNGLWNVEEINNIRNISRRKFEIIGIG